MPNRYLHLRKHDMKKPNGSAIRLSRSILGIRPISVSYKLFPQSQLRRNKGLYNMVL